MCGRYTLTSAPEALRALFGYAEQPNFPPRYNIAPTQPIAIVRLVDGNRYFALVRWGLLPSWVKDPKTFTLLINARGESAAEKPTFRAAMKRRRCLIPADGYYEWQATGDRKRPFYVHAKSGKPLAFAGLWETWMGPNGEELETAAIVTTTASHTSPRNVANESGWASREYRAMNPPPTAATKAARAPTITFTWSTLRPRVRDAASLSRTARRARPLVDRRRLTIRTAKTRKTPKAR